MRESELSSSSVSPSEKYSCSLSPLKFTNGSTAMECGGGLKAVGAAVAGAAGGVGGDAACFKNVSANRCPRCVKYASAAKTTTATVTHCAGFDHEGPRALG